MLKRVTFITGKVDKTRQGIYYDFDTNKIYRARDTFSQQEKKMAQYNQPMLPFVTALGLILTLRPFSTMFYELISRNNISIQSCVIVVTLVNLFLVVLNFNLAGPQKDDELFVTKSEFLKLRENLKKQYVVAIIIQTTFILFLIFGANYLVKIVGHHAILIGYIYATIQAFFVVSHNPFFYRKFLRNHTYESIYKEELKLEEVIKAQQEKKQEALYALDSRINLDKIEKYPYKSKQEAYALLNELQHNSANDGKEKIIMRLLELSEIYKDR